MHTSNVYPFNPYIFIYYFHSAQSTNSSCLILFARKIHSGERPFEFEIRSGESDRGGPLSKYLGRPRDCKQYRIARLAGAYDNGSANFVGVIDPTLGNRCTPPPPSHAKLCPIVPVSTTRTEAFPARRSKPKVV